jgi:uncharacterized protein (DUF486 family)
MAKSVLAVYQSFVHSSAAAANIFVVFAWHKTSNEEKVSLIIFIIIAKLSLR